MSILTWRFHCCGFALGLGFQCYGCGIGNTKTMRSDCWSSICGPANEKALTTQSSRDCSLNHLGFFPRPECDETLPEVRWAILKPHANSTVLRLFSSAGSAVKLRKLEFPISFSPPYLCFRKTSNMLRKLVLMFWHKERCWLCHYRWSFSLSDPLMGP